MQWLRAHPFAVLVSSFGIALVVFVWIFELQNGARQSPTPAWGTTTTNVAFDSTLPVQNLPPVNSPLPQSAPGGIDLTGVPLATAAATNTAATSATAQAPASVATPVINPPAGAPPGAGALGNDLLSQAYSFLPSVYATSTLATSAGGRTPEQQALYQYGNAAGLAVLTFENAHADMTQVLKDWIAARATPGSAASAETIADDLARMADSIANLQNVPPEAAAANAALASSTASSAENLKNVFAAGGDDAKLANAMKTYDASVEDYTRKYLALVDLFSAHGVSFSRFDTGAAFSFSSAQGL